MQNDEPAGSAPDADAADDELRVEDLRVEDLPGAASRWPVFARRIWRFWTSGMRRPGRHRLLPVSGVWALVLIVLALALVTSDGQSFAGIKSIGGGVPVPMPVRAGSLSTVLVGSAPQPLGGGWERFALPAGPGRAARSIAPSLFNPSEVLACVSQAGEPHQLPPPTGPLVIWRTHDAGMHWTALPLPGLVGNLCNLRVAPDGSPGVALLAYEGLNTTPYLSQDDGNDWMRITPPPTPDPSATFVARQFWATADHLYYWYSYDAYDTTATVPAGNGFGPGTATIPHYIAALWRSDNNGRTWQRADGGLESMLADPYPTSDQNRLVARVYRGSGNGMQAEVWETRDAGQAWHVATTIGEFSGLLVVPTGGSDAVTARAPDYAMLEEQIPSDLFRLSALERAGSGSWTTLPPLPVPGAKAGRTGLLQMYEETGDGRLLAFGADPQAGVPSADGAQAKGWTGQPKQWLWIWDERVGRWLVWPTPLAVPYRWGCGVCLEHHATWATGPAAHGATASGTYLWLSDVLADGFGNGQVAYRLFVPAGPPGQLISPG
jgi:hypothetical protein